jgi:hypothetical protein
VEGNFIAKPIALMSSILPHNGKFEEKWLFIELLEVPTISSTVSTLPNVIKGPVTFLLRCRNWCILYEQEGFWVDHPYISFPKYGPQVVSNFVL